MNRIHSRCLGAVVVLASRARGAGVEFYSSEIGESPIARKDTEFERFLALVWRF